MLLHNCQVSLVEIRSLPRHLSSLLTFFCLSLSLYCCIFLLSLFHFCSGSKYLKVVRLPSFCFFKLFTKNVSYVFFKQEFKQIYWFIAGEFSLWVLLLHSYTKESAPSFPEPKRFFPGWKKLILRFPLKSARGPDHSGKHTAMLHHHPNLRALRGQGPLQYDFSPTYEVFA